MPDIGQTIRDRLVSDPTISGKAGSRVSADALPQSQALPAITYRVIDTVAGEILAPGINDVSRARLQVECYASTRGEATELADDVRLSLQSFKGLIGTQQINGITMATGEQYFDDPVEAGSDSRRYITTQDFFVHYRTTTA